jgi:hypothetical protein
MGVQRIINEHTAEGELNAPFWWYAVAIACASSVARCPLASVEMVDKSPDKLELERVIKIHSSHNSLLFRSALNRWERNHCAKKSLIDVDLITY